MRPTGANCREQPYRFALADKLRQRVQSTLCQRLAEQSFGQFVASQDGTALIDGEQRDRYRIVDVAVLARRIKGEFVRRHLAPAAIQVSEQQRQAPGQRSQRDGSKATQTAALRYQ